MQLESVRNLKSRKRSTPPETWPESIDVFRALVASSEPLTVRALSIRLVTPEITLRSRLAKLELANAIYSNLETVASSADALKVSRKYYITEYGRQCVAEAAAPPKQKHAERNAQVSALNSVFSVWGRS
ncbi:MAG: hypothetical protein U1E84_16710 [Rhodoferax sp.]